MIKMIFCLRRKPGLSLEDFQSYWYDRHAPLVREHGPALGLRKYVQVHTVPGPLNDAVRRTRNAPVGYDGVAELWYDEQELMQKSVTPEGQRAGQALLEDEKNFIDHENSPLFFARERPILGGS